MAWSLPHYSRGKVDEAGDRLQYPDIGLDDSYQKSLEIVNDWRASYSWPLSVIRKTLERRAKSINPQALIAQRIKRLQSIEPKLRIRKLTQIQDIGGCRAVMPTVEEALELVRMYQEVKIQSELHKVNDYIAQPKTDGYRSVHLVYKYHTDTQPFSACNGHRIEIQIRSQLQHAWATAVETVSTFARLPLRETGQDSMLLRNIYFIGAWRRFFVLMASAIAMREQQPLAPEAPADKKSLVAELRDWAEKLHVVNLLSNWTVTIRDLPAKIENDVAQFLITLDPENRSVSTKSFGIGEASQAFKEYIEAELPRISLPSTNAVLVSVDSMAELRTAYPNYYADTRAFIDALQIAIE